MSDPDHRNTQVALHQEKSSTSSTDEKRTIDDGASPKHQVSVVDGKYEDDADSLGLGEGLEITMRGPAPTDEERATLRKVPARIPYLALMIAFLELCERASYYGLTGAYESVQYLIRTTP